MHAPKDSMTKQEKFMELERTVVWPALSAMSNDMHYTCLGQCPGDNEMVLDGNYTIADLELIIATKKKFDFLVKALCE